MKSSRVSINIIIVIVIVIIIILTLNSITVWFLSCAYCKHDSGKPLVMQDSYRHYRCRTLYNMLFRDMV